MKLKDAGADSRRILWVVLAERSYACVQRMAYIMGKDCMLENTF